MRTSRVQLGRRATEPQCGQWGSVLAGADLDAVLVFVLDHLLDGEARQVEEIGHVHLFRLQSLRLWTGEHTTAASTTTPCIAAKV
ncbi:hypothetical protein [Azospirillum endophyticum]